MPTKRSGLCTGGLKHPERYQARFYDMLRSFTVLTQDDAFAWIEKWLQAGGVKR